MLSKQAIFALITSLGYKPFIFETAERQSVSKNLSLRFLIAAFCSLNVMMFAYPLYATYFDYDEEQYGTLFAWLSFYFSLPVLFYCAYPIFRRFWTSFKAGFFGMEALVVMGVSTAFGLSCYELFTGGNKVYFDSMTVIIAFVLLGKIIESKAKFSSKDSLLTPIQGDAAPRTQARPGRDAILRFFKGDCPGRYFYRLHRRKNRPGWSRDRRGGILR